MVLVGQMLRVARVSMEPDPLARTLKYFIDAMGVKSIPSREHAPDSSCYRPDPFDTVDGIRSILEIPTRSLWDVHVCQKQQASCSYRASCSRPVCNPKTGRIEATALEYFLFGNRNADGLPARGKESELPRGGDVSTRSIRRSFAVFRAG